MNNTFHRRAFAVVVLAICAGLASASGAIARTATCLTVFPRTEYNLRVSGATCGFARGLDRFQAHHDTTDDGFFFDRRFWAATVYSRAHGHTYFNYVSPGREPIMVWIEYRRPVD